MNKFFLVAGIVAFLVGLAHTVMGEILIFRRVRKNGVIPTDGGNILRERHVRILWASWHVLSVFGWAMGAELIWLATSNVTEQTSTIVAGTTSVAMLAGSLLVLVGTKGRHPGWLGLLIVAVLTFLGMPS